MTKNFQAREYREGTVYFNKSTQSYEVDGYLTNFTMKDGGKTIHFEYMPRPMSRKRYNGMLTTFDRSYQFSPAPHIDINLTSSELSELKSTIEQTRQSDI